MRYAVAVASAMAVVTLLLALVAGAMAQDEVTVLPPVYFPPLPQSPYEGETLTTTQCRRTPSGYEWFQVVYKYKPAADNKCRGRWVAEPRKRLNPQPNRECDADDYEASRHFANEYFSDKTPDAEAFQLDNPPKITIVDADGTEHELTGDDLVKALAKLNTPGYDPELATETKGTSGGTGGSTSTGGGSTTAGGGVAATDSTQSTGGSSGAGGSTTAGGGVAATNSTQPTGASSGADAGGKPSAAAANPLPAAKPAKPAPPACQPKTGFVDPNDPNYPPKMTEAQKAKAEKECKAYHDKLEAHEKAKMGAFDKIIEWITDKLFSSLDGAKPSPALSGGELALARDLAVPTLLARTAGRACPAYEESFLEAQSCDDGPFQASLASLVDHRRQLDDIEAAAAREQQAAETTLSESLGELARISPEIDGQTLQRQASEALVAGATPAGGAGVAEAAIGIRTALDALEKATSIADAARPALHDALRQAVRLRLAERTLAGAREAAADTDWLIAQARAAWDASCHPHRTPLQPGRDVAKNDIVLIDTKTQEKIPGGKLVLIPDDPMKPIPPPAKVRNDGKVTLPPVQPEDRLVFLPDRHEKTVLDGSQLPNDGGGRLLVPTQRLRLIVHDTPCPAVTDAEVGEGLADQYGARLAAGGERAWRGVEQSFAIAAANHQSCIVDVPRYDPLKPGKPPRIGHPKDGPTRTKDGKLIEGDQPREIQGPAPLEPFATSRGSWGQAYADQWYLAAVRWLKADGTTVLPASATPVTVAVIDTGVDFSHPQLAGANWVNPSPGRNGDLYGWSFIDDNPDIRDLSGHGTIVAGIIAASSEGRFGIAGINPWARIMALKAMELDGTGGSIGLSQAIVYAVDHGARVINLSVGGPTLTMAEQDAIDYAAQRDVLVVVASGNEGIDTAKFSPAGLKNVLAVAAVGPDLKRQAFSNWGATIGIAAPGVDILSLRARQTDLLQMTRRDYKPGTAVVANQFYRVTGSSFAAPIVSGAASLLLSIKPTLTAVQVKRMLLQSARDLEKIGTNQFSGYGLLDIAAALAADPDAYAEAAITGVSVVQAQGRTMVRVLGTATADKLADAHLEIGAGRNPTKWKPVLRPLTMPVAAGALGDIPAEAFAGSNQWTLRVVVTDAKGLRREARFTLTLG
jgi:uncharacterized membrane protein YgcG